MSDIYSEQGIKESFDADEIDSAEYAFMLGYLKSGEENV